MVTNCFFVSMYDAKTKRWPIPSSKDLKKLQQEAGLFVSHGSSLVITRLSPGYHWLSLVITGYSQEVSLSASFS